MTQVEKLIKIIMPDLLKYLKMKESGELAQKRLDICINKNKSTANFKNPVATVAIGFFRYYVIK